MRKKILAISFLLLYLAFMILPTFPLMQYYIFEAGANCVSAAKGRNFSNGDHTKTGDMAYLHALLKSASDKNSKNKNTQSPSPSTNNEINNLIYLTTTNTHLSFLTPGISLHFPVFNEPLTERYLQVLVPPPNTKG
jgi:hypothetical protein